MPTKVKIITVVGIFYGLVLVLFLAKFDYNPSGTIMLGDKTLAKMTALPFPGSVIFKDSKGFDGQYYYFIASSPYQLNYEIDSNWGQRIIYPVVANTLAFGHQKFLALTMILVNFLAILGSLYFLMKLLDSYGAKPALALIWAFNVGFLICLTRDLAEPLMFLWIIISLLWLKKDKHFLAALFLGLAVLTREMALLVAGPVLIYFLFKKSTVAFFYLLPILIYGAWQTFIYYHYGDQQFLPALQWYDFFGIWQVAIYLKTLGYITLGNLAAIFMFLGYGVAVWQIFYKSCRLTLYRLIFLNFIILAFFLRGSQYLNLENIGRYTMGVVLFYTLCLAEKKFNPSKLFYVYYVGVAIYIFLLITFSISYSIY